MPYNREWKHYLYKAVDIKEQSRCLICKQHIQPLLYLAHDAVISFVSCFHSQGKPVCPTMNVLDRQGIHHAFPASSKVTAVCLPGSILKNQVCFHSVICHFSDLFPLLYHFTLLHVHPIPVLHSHQPTSIPSSAVPLHCTWASCLSL